ncbi:MAG: glycosyltransferase [Tyzzerella sp.]|nr:glycosyltransferase [Tyzzerella sp.]
MEQLKVSVIVPVYNVEDYLRQCLDSIVAQTYHNCEVIIVNDGSTDSSGKISKEYATKYSNIIYIEQENAGLAAARQAGLDIATGDYIGFVDSDDWLEHNMYEKMMDVAIETDAEIVFCNVYRNESKKETPYLEDGYYNREAMEKFIFPRLLASFDEDKQENNIRWCNWLRIYKKSLIDKNHIRFDPRFRRCQDLPFTFECTIHANSYYYLGSEYLYHNRMNYESLSKGYTKNMWGLIKPLVNYLWDVVKDYKDYDFSEQMKLRAALFAFECADNELKPNNVKPYSKKVNTIRMIMKDKDANDWLKDIKEKRFNKTVRLYVLCFRMKMAHLFYAVSRHRYATRFREYKIMNEKKDN